MASASLAALQGALSFTLLSEVRELVSTEDELLALSGSIVTLGVCSIDIILYDTLLDSLKETAIILYTKENLPTLVGERCSELFNEVATCTRVNNLVEMALLLKQELLVACDTLRELCRLLINGIKRSNLNRMNTCKGSTHCLGLRTEQVNIAVEQGHVIL